MSSSFALRSLLRTATTLTASSISASRSVVRSAILPQSPVHLPKPVPLFHVPIRCYADDPQDTPIPASLQETLNFIKIPGLNEEEERKFQILQFETEVLRQSGYRIPTEVDEKGWRKLMTMDSKHQRLKYYGYLFKTEMAEKKIRRQKEEKSKVRLAKHEQMEKERLEIPGVMQYGLSHNTLFPYIRDSVMLEKHNFKLARARCIGQPLVLDLGFDQWMTEREMINTATQIRDAYAYNRDSRDPFWLQLCNVNFDGPTYKALEGALGNLDQPSCLIEFSSKSYLDLFPKEKIVYLTYNAEYTLNEFNDEDVYIMGAMVDKTNPKPLTMAKAKREGLRMAKLPIDTYVRWAIGGKNLAINQVVAMLCDVKRDGDWEKALRAHIPKRKLFQPEDEDPNAKPYHKPRLNMNARLRQMSRERSAYEIMT